jgi:hypothetical protein
VQSNRFLFLAIVIILIINIVLLGRVGELNNQVQNLRHNYNNLQSSINSISGNVNNTLDRFTREQSWITPVQVNDHKTWIDDEKGLAVLNWQIKDFKEGAEVVFHYRQSRSGEFNAIPAQDKGDGFFEVTLPFDIKVEPFWEIGVSKSSAKGSVTSEMEVKPPNPDYQSISYYVSMKTGDITRSSEIAYIDVAYLAKIKYETIVGHVAIHDDKYNISLFGGHNRDNSIQSATVLLYDRSRVVDERALEVKHSEGGSKTYSANYEAGSQNITRLVIRVTYNNGKTFEKEVYL